MKCYSWRHTSLQTWGEAAYVACIRLYATKNLSWISKSLRVGRIKAERIQWGNAETPNQCLEDRFCFCSHFYYFPALWPWMSHLSLERHFLLPQVVIRNPVPTLLLEDQGQHKSSESALKVQSDHIRVSDYSHFHPRVHSCQWRQEAEDDSKYRVVVTLTRLQAMVSFYWCSCTCAAVFPC